ncbi:cation:proton antiporter domain-containing protein [Barrientosiimonas endolithica]|uniref:Cation/H+ exchanger transmembrane domain-containing protein n=1 Tax=Barrientosiimonas endolithica TaxID=1535208 RepID=A0ABN6YPL6_9MICO|nr:cation:proton antiporter [Barrientosiimonas endolithica]BDZ59369.1 hypothetical protein GCM10025872_30260 [Barrientosiimonas endolithica]
MPTLAAATSVGITDRLTTLLLIGSVVLLLGVAAVRLANRSGLPTLLLYLGIGMALGSSGLGISFDDEAMAQALGYAALVLILAEGGLTTDWSAIRGSVGAAAMLSTVGVVVSVLVVGVAANLLLGVPWNVALLVGAVLSSTDAAAVFSVLRRVPLPARLSGVLEAESGFNDAPVVLLVVALAAQATPGSSSTAGPSSPARRSWSWPAARSSGSCSASSSAGCCAGAPRAPQACSRSPWWA